MLKMISFSIGLHSKHAWACWDSASKRYIYSQEEITLALRCLCNTRALHARRDCKPRGSKLRASLREESCQTPSTCTRLHIGGGGGGVYIEGEVSFRCRCGWFFSLFNILRRHFQSGTFKSINVPEKGTFCHSDSTCSTYLSTKRRSRINGAPN